VVIKPKKSSGFQFLRRFVTIQVGHIGLGVGGDGFYSSFVAEGDVIYPGLSAEFLYRFHYQFPHALTSSYADQGGFKFQDQLGAFLGHSFCQIGLERRYFFSIGEGLG